MLHILWLILRIILTLVGILLGILLLLLLLLLFCPVRYQASVSKAREAPLNRVEACGKVSWLFRGISFEIAFREGKPGNCIRIFGLPLERWKSMFGKRTAGKKKKSEPETSADTAEEREDTQDVGSREEYKDAGKSEPSPGDHAETDSAADAVNVGEREETQDTGGAKECEDAQDAGRVKECEETQDTGGAKECEETQNAGGEKKCEDAKNVANGQEREDTQGAGDEDEREDTRAQESGSTGEDASPESSGGFFLFRLLGGLFRLAAGILRKLWNLILWIFSIPEKISHVLESISSRLKNIGNTVSWWKDFITHPGTRAFLSLLWDSLKGLVRHISPTKVQGNITFGSDDPSVTGTVLAVLGMSWPLHRNCVAVTPVFDEGDVLEGEIHLKGRTYGVVLVKTALAVLINKNTRNVIARWKRKEV
ncbi:MAG: DUF2953 domain-containing protein [Clostridiales bacterium]|nr:DUF2953 domain-containing protein [Clostridiales bacterium]